MKLIQASVILFMIVFTINLASAFTINSYYCEKTYDYILKYGKSYSEIDIVNDKVADSDLIVNLAGVQFLGRIRGITEVKEVVNESNENGDSKFLYIIFSILVVILIIGIVIVKIKSSKKKFRKKIGKRR